ncbi:MAG: class II aldolase/adducin family protein [Beijerinckiaceae bacterium]
MRLFACACCSPYAARYASPADAGSGGARPRHASGGKVDPALLDDLVAANLILASEGVLDGYGHVSMRHPDNPERYFISRSLAPATVTRQDLVECTLDSDYVDPDAPASYLERYIHGSIYKARPDVNCVVHSHSPTVIPFANSKTPLRAMGHVAGFLAGRVPVFDIKDKFGATDMLVKNNDHGAALAEVLGDRPIALMRGHGNVVTAPDVKVGVFRAYYTEVNARQQIQVQSLDGPVTYLDEAEGEKCNEMIAATSERPWLLWKKKVGMG